MMLGFQQDVNSGLLPDVTRFTRSELLGLSSVDSLRLMFMVYGLIFLDFYYTYINTP